MLHIPCVFISVFVNHQQSTLYYLNMFIYLYLPDKYILLVRNKRWADLLLYEHIKDDTLGVGGEKVIVHKCILPYGCLFSLECGKSFFEHSVESLFYVKLYIYAFLHSRTVNATYLLDTENLL